MLKSSESEILAKIFADMGEKCGENLAENLADFRLPISGKLAARNLTKNPRQIQRAMKLNSFT